jgi:ribosomal protein L37E
MTACLANSSVARARSQIRPGTARINLSNSERPYAWQCFACEASNPPGTDPCSSCGFPARATGRQIDAARAAKTTAAAKPIVLQKRSAFAAIADALSPLPMWRQVLAAIGGLLAVGGALWLKLTMSFPGIASSLGATILGIVLMAAGTGKR